MKRFLTFALSAALAVAALASSYADNFLTGVSMAWASVKRMALKVFVGPTDVRSDPKVAGRPLVAAKSFGQAQMQRSRPQVTPGGWRMCSSI